MPSHQPGPIAAIAAFVLAAALPLAAAAADAPAAFQACMNAAQSTPEYTACAGTEMERQDRLLNEAWHRVAEKMKSFDKGAFDLLLTEQRNWIKWKDSACTYYLQSFGSEGRSVHYPFCFIRILQDRVTYLNELAGEL